MQDKTHDPCFLSSLVAQLLCQAPVPSPFNTSDTHRHSLFHCCHKRSDKSNISKQGSVLARFCRVQSLLTRMAWSQRQLGPRCPQSGCRERCTLLLCCRVPSYSVQDLRPWDDTAHIQGTQPRNSLSGMPTILSPRWL